MRSIWIWVKRLSFVALLGFLFKVAMTYATTTGDENMRAFLSGIERYLKPAGLMLDHERSEGWPHVRGVVAQLRIFGKRLRGYFTRNR